MPWYHSSNTGRMATIKNNCSLFIEVKRLGASGTGHACEADSDFSNSFDAILFLRVEEVEAVEAGGDEEVSKHPGRSHGWFCKGYLMACEGVTARPPDHETSLTPAGLLPQVGEGPIGLGASNP